MEGREKTKEELDEEKSIFYAQEKLIEENKQDLNFLHKKAEDIFYNESYSEWRWDSLFRLVTMYIEDHHNPASLPVLLRLCDDDRYYHSVFRDGWRNVLVWSYEREDLCREYFKNLHEVFPQAPEMGASLYCAISWEDLELQKKYVVLSKPEAFRELYEIFFAKSHMPASVDSYYPWVPYDVDELELDEIRETLGKLKQYYDAHRLQVV